MTTVIIIYYDILYIISDWYRFIGILTSASVIIIIFIHELKKIYQNIHTYYSYAHMYMYVYMHTYVYMYLYIQNVIIHNS